MKSLWRTTVSSSNRDSVTSVVADSHENIYISGYTNGSISHKGSLLTTHRGDSDAYAAKLSRDGDIEWMTGISTPAWDSAWSIAHHEESGSTYVAGYSNGSLNGEINQGPYGTDIFVVKLDNKGETEWTRFVGGGGSADVAVASNGDVLLSGYTDNNYKGIINKGADDYFVTRFSPEGQELWSLSEGGTGYDRVEDIVVASDSSIYVTGFSDSPHLSGQANIGLNDAFVAKISTDGEVLWTKLIGGAGSDEAWYIKEGNDNKIWVAGQTELGFSGHSSTSFDIFVASVDNQGVLSTNVLSSTTDEYSRGIEITDSGKFLIAKSSLGGYQIAESNHSGSTLSVTSLPGEVWDIHQANGNLIAVGSFLNPLNNNDGYILKTTDVSWKSDKAINAEQNSGSIESFARHDSINLFESIDDISTNSDVTTFKLVKSSQLQNQQFEFLMSGTEKKDKITGSLKGEILSGGKGKDVLKGGDGADGFLFQTPDFGKKEADKIRDFNYDEGDTIIIYRKIFEVGKKVSLKSVSGKKALKKAFASNKEFVYDEKKGFLYFNENGKEKGWGDGGLFVKLQGAPELGTSDFTMI